MNTTPSNTRIRQGLVAAAFFLIGASSALAADPFPTKPIHIVVPTAAGGLADVTARQVAIKMSGKLGQPVVVDNRPGADTLLGTRVVKDAAPDGYTLLLQADGVTVWPSLKRDPGYDLEKDFTAVGPILRLPYLLLVSAEKPDKTLAEFIVRGKSSPKSMSFASGGVGTPPHIGAAIFLNQAGLELMHVPYKGNAAAMPDVVGGRVDMIMDPYATSNGLVKTGKLRALAVSSAKRHPGLPDVPTFAEQGLPNAGFTSWLGLLAPAGTPKDVLQRLSEALQSAIKSNEMSERIRSDGNEPMLMSPDEFNKALKAQLGQMAQLVNELKLEKMD